MYRRLSGQRLGFQSVSGQTASQTAANRLQF